MSFFARSLSLIAAGALFQSTIAHAKTATTQLESTPVRAKASALSGSIAQLPAGTEVTVLGTDSSFTQIEFKNGGKKMKGFIPSASLKASGSSLASLGTGTKKKTGYGKSDVASAISSAAKIADATDAAAAAGNDALGDLEDSTAVVEDDLGDLGDSMADAGSALAGDAVDSAMGTAAAKKKQLDGKKAELEAKKKELTDAPMNAVAAKKKELEDKKAALEAKKNELAGAPMNALDAKKKELEAKKAELAGAPMSAIETKKKELADKKAALEAKKNDLSAAPMNAMNSKKKELEDKKAALETQGNDMIAGQRAAVDGKIGELNDKKAEAEAIGDLFTEENAQSQLASAAAPGRNAVRRASGVGDMSSVEALEALEVSRDEFAPTAPFMRDGKLKSKVLK